MLGIGLVPALILSWVFELTHEGLKKDDDVDHEQPASLQAARNLDRIILVVLALALGYFAFDKFVLAPQHLEEEVAEARQEGRSEALVESYGEQSIAVLAFDDMSPDGDQEYLSDGIAEEVLHLLEKIDGLRVISRTSAFSFKGKDVPIPAIAEQLNVAHILEGSVRKAGDRIRVTAQLIDARTDTHLWSETYDRTLDDIFAIQDELAVAMVDQLNIELLGQLPTVKRVDPDAYLLWLEGHQNVAYVNPDKAALLLEKVVEIEPDFADAWSDLSRAYLQMSTTFSQKDHAGDENWFKAETAIQRLFEIDPLHPLILGGQAWLTAEKKGGLQKAAALFEESIEHHPDSWDVIRIATFYSS
jgi:TolB-like protein